MEHPAFPLEWLDDTIGITRYYKHQSGMTLRDYFAGQAIIGLSQIWGERAHQHETLAINAWEIADAMLAIKERKGS